MTALAIVAALRRKGLKPPSVWVDLVPDGRRPMPQDVADPHFGGIVWLDIPRSIGIADLDFRPLVGLSVQLGDSAGDPIRLRAVAKAIAEVEPASLCVFVERDGATTMHRRTAGNPPTQGSFRL